MQERFKTKYRTLGLNIAYFRKQKGWTQEDLAEHSRIDRSSISKTEIAWSGTSLDTVFAIAEALEVPVSKLFEER
ncbi:helix-turn-helix domain-containing protein [Feifania hominis]|uniref:Helix-turn-helix transcriptional regulator n=1 Tax=Feifania hominis TaxID=2763660 RepID=A0A926DC58_9FIRM|nr:helix-turn-helix transcriptional regulator [Feifania hominis]MBC8535121.1 helix-turn-helix transcriptional regulator [Feifania hominis]